jgi:hypothetical protein
MNWKSAYRNFNLLLLIVAVSACSSMPVATPTTELVSTKPVVDTQPPATEIASPTEMSVGTPSGLCANPYYPVRQGATWTYASTGGPTGGYGFTDTITSVTNDGFTLTSQFGDLTRTQEWACQPEGLVALQLGGTSAAMLNNDKMNITLDVDHVTGVTIPSQIQPGDTWQHELEFTGTIGALGQEIKGNGDATSSFQAIGNESVTVPAGTFDALKIHIETTINISGSFNGVTFPVKVVTPYDYWFVQDVGWVKAAGTGTVGTESFSETIELQSYTIP